MNVDAYIDGLERSAKNLPSVLADWKVTAPELRAHFVDAIVEQLVLFQSVESQAGLESRQRLLASWSAFRDAVVRHARELEAFMDFKPLELLAPAWISYVAPTSDASPSADDGEALAA